MASAVFYGSVQPLIFSRSQIPGPISKDYFEEFSQPINCKYYFRSNPCGQKKRVLQVKATLAEPTPAPPAPALPSKNLRILVAGGGIGGLVFALAAKRKGFDVVVFEKDLSAIRGEGQYRGPIQIQSNALAALEAVDMEVAEEVMRAGCITGDRINGLVDGVSGHW